ncbi:hypothetical protein HYH03_013269 [Edaphochlamys debaryana]|uniref:Uncharacterized protein n=1 Tax=Edaphochlamys debaryana TaxID=47281 RepID=A0A835XR89_9CHLO|nr:hypothetical protein HYH03_013269 [Edaphochlamys debaryana]|eukprot:KAG2488122.1 hypothetical protein HYH03_013269 [Edaphochlamys debaryana]
MPSSLLPSRGKVIHVDEAAAAGAPAAAAAPLPDEEAEADGGVYGSGVVTKGEIPGAMDSAAPRGSLGGRGDVAPSGTGSEAAPSPRDRGSGARHPRSSSWASTPDHAASPALMKRDPNADEDALDAAVPTRGSPAASPAPSRPPRLSPGASAAGPTATTLVAAAEAPPTSPSEAAGATSAADGVQLFAWPAPKPRTPRYSIGSAGNGPSSRRQSLQAEAAADEAAANATGGSNSGGGSLSTRRGASRDRSAQQAAAFIHGPGAPPVSGFGGAHPMADHPYAAERNSNGDGGDGGGGGAAAAAASGPLLGASAGPTSNSSVQAQSTPLWVLASPLRRGSAGTPAGTTAGGAIDIIDATTEATAQIPSPSSRHASSDARRTRNLSSPLAPRLIGAPSLASAYTPSTGLTSAGSGSGTAAAVAAAEEVAAVRSTPLGAASGGIGGRRPVERRAALTQGAAAFADDDDELAAPSAPGLDSPRRGQAPVLPRTAFLPSPSSPAAPPPARTSAVGLGRASTPTDPAAPAPRPTAPTAPSEHPAGAAWAFALPSQGHFQGSTGAAAGSGAVDAASGRLAHSSTAPANFEAVEEEEQEREEQQQQHPQQAAPAAVSQPAPQPAGRRWLPLSRLLGELSGRRAQGLGRAASVGGDEETGPAGPESGDQPPVGPGPSYSRARNRTGPSEAGSCGDGGDGSAGLLSTGASVTGGGEGPGGGGSGRAARLPKGKDTRPVRRAVTFTLGAKNCNAAAVAAAKTGSAAGSGSASASAQGSPAAAGPSALEAAAQSLAKTRDSLDGTRSNAMRSKNGRSGRNSVEMGVTPGQPGMALPDASSLNRAVWALRERGAGARGSRTASGSGADRAAPAALLASLSLSSAAMTSAGAASAATASAATASAAAAVERSVASGSAAVSARGRSERSQRLRAAPFAAMMSLMSDMGGLGGGPSGSGGGGSGGLRAGSVIGPAAARFRRASALAGVGAVSSGVRRAASGAVSDAGSAVAPEVWNKAHRVGGSGTGSPAPAPVRRPGPDSSDRTARGGSGSESGSGVSSGPAPAPVPGPGPGHGTAPYRRLARPGGPGPGPDSSGIGSSHAQPSDFIPVRASSPLGQPDSGPQLRAASGPVPAVPGPGAADPAGPGVGPGEGLRRCGSRRRLWPGPGGPGALEAAAGLEQEEGLQVVDVAGLVMEGGDNNRWSGENAVEAGSGGVSDWMLERAAVTAVERAAAGAAARRGSGHSSRAGAGEAGGAGGAARGRGAWGDEEEAELERLPGPSPPSLLSLRVGTQ